jgi:hypothetical protein
MDKNLQNIEDLFKKGLEGNEESPSEEVWNTIDQSLEKASSLRFRKKYYTLRWATAFLAVGLAAMSIYLLKNESQKQNAVKAKTENLLTSEPPSAKSPSENTGTPPAIIEETPAEEKSPEEKTPATEKQQINQLETGKSDSQQLGMAKSNLNSETAIVAHNTVPPVNENNTEPQQSPEQAKSFNKKMAQADNKRRSSDLSLNNKPGSNQSESVSPSENHVLPSPSVTFDAHELSSLNRNQDLKDASTLSPYSSPAKTMKRTPIHIAARPRFYATVFYSPNIPFSHLRDEEHGYGNPFSRELERKEKGSYSYSFGVAVEYRMNNQLAVESGLNLSTIKMHLEPEKIFAERDNQGSVKYQINTSSGKAYTLPSFSTNPQIGDSLFTKNINHSLQYTGIPLAAKYYISNKRLSVNVLAGVSINILSHGKISTDVNRGNETEHENIHEIHGLKPVYFSGLAGLGLSYNIYGSYSLTFSPAIDFAIEPINKDVPVNSYPGTLNFQFGLKTRL